MKNDIACIDLFCGAGGLTSGLAAEGIPVVAGIDVDRACRHPYETNNTGRFIERDITDISAAELEPIFGDAGIRVLAGCAPCQPFSTYSQRYETTGTPRWGLLYQFARLVGELKPEIVTMENVRNINNHQVFPDFLAALEDQGYEIFHEIVDSASYGLPQRRRRTVLLASRLGPINLISRTHEKHLTVRRALSKLPAIAAGEIHSRDNLHTSPSLSPMNMKRIEASRQGGTWRDWPDELILDCHKRSTGKTYPSVYGRMSWDEPSPTLTTQFYGYGNGRYGHPKQNRAISLREGAILQGFPASYSFVPKGKKAEFKTLGRLIGNAVPVTLGRAIGRSINEHLATKINKNTHREKNRDETEALVA